MADCASLPCALVERITRLARGRTIAGTNRYARVCRQWRDAGSISDEADPQRLYIEKREYDRDQARLVTWLSTHGDHVDVLIVEADMEEASYKQHQHQQLNWFLGPAAALCNLTRLEVAQRDSLVLLAPVLGQLPQLRHLAANIRLAPSLGNSQGSPHSAPATSPPQPFSGAPSTFLDPHGKVLGHLPDLQQLCPKLARLQLNLQPRVSPTRGNPIETLAVDKQLHQLLPACLQQLTLAQSETRWCTLVLPLSCLSHLSTLQALELRDLLVAQDEPGELLRLQSLQQLTLCSSSTIVVEDTFNEEDSDLKPIQDGLQQLAPLVTDCEVSTMRDVVIVEDAGHLTRLVLTQGLQFYSLNARAALTGLRELDLGECGSRLAAAVEQAAGMPALRSLSLKGEINDPAAFSSSLARCTQLTALGLLAPAPQLSDGDDGQHSDNSMDDSDEDSSQPPEPWTHALQQLTGLRRLSVYAALLEWEEGAWLVPLTALSRLSGTMPRMHSRQSVWPRNTKTFWASWSGPELMDLNLTKAKEYLQQLQGWPASLQQVVFPITEDLRLCQCVMPRWLEVRAWEGAPPKAVPAKFVSWLELPPTAANGWTRYFSRCRHLPGVWELQGQLHGNQQLQVGDAVQPPQGLVRGH